MNPTQPVALMQAGQHDGLALRMESVSRPWQTRIETQNNVAPTPAPEGVPSTSFASVLEQAVEHANQVQLHAQEKVDLLARGAMDDVHGTMIAVKEGEFSMHLIGSVRNKLLEAFHDLWRTSV